MIRMRRTNGEALSFTLKSHDHGSNDDSDNVNASETDEQDQISASKSKPNPASLDGDSVSASGASKSHVQSNSKRFVKTNERETKRDSADAGNGSAKAQRQSKRTPFSIRG